MNINREEIIWAAGFFDGEGNVRAYLRNRSIELRFQMAQVDRQVLDRFQAAVLGLGGVYGPYDPPKGSLNRQRKWHFAAASFEDVQALVAMLYQFLSPVKKEQCLGVLKRYSEWRSTFVPLKSGPAKGSHHKNPRKRRA